MFTVIFVQPLFNILFLLYALLPGHDFGVAVIGLTLIVRAILWPLVTRQLHSQKAMQRLQPKVAAVRAEAKGDRQKESQLLMELYKKEGTSPFASLLPLLVQLPILFALVAVFSDAVHPNKIAELAYPFAAHLPQVAAIINHQINFTPTLFGMIDLTKPNPYLAIAAGLAGFLQTKMLQPKQKQGQKLDDQARMMQSMIYLMPVLTVVFAWNFASALSLYWTVTSLAAAFQQYWVLLRDAHEMEEAEDVQEATPALVTAEATAGGSRKSNSAKSKKARRKAGKK